jgi:hypothetical protein
MSTLNTILFAVGAFVFMLTVYGAVMAGGEVLKQKQLEGLGDDTEEIVDDKGFEFFVTSAHADDETPNPRATER